MDLESREFADFWVSAWASRLIGSYPPEHPGWTPSGGPLFCSHIIGPVGLAGILHERRDEIVRTAARHGTGNIRLFGSVARGGDTIDSDVDLLVDVTAATSSWFPASLTAELEEFLGKRVQVVICLSLSPLIRDAVLQESIPL